MQKKSAVINIIWLLLILVSIVVAAYTGRMQEITDASFDSAKSAVTLAISLIGVMALWLGIMKVAEVGGLMRIIARAIRPVMIRLFPDVPADHPAMSAMIMNMAANMLGLGNAATPMGIKAMQELESINSEKGTATNAMCLFLAINTSSVALLPLGVMTVRAAAGAQNPTSILIPSILATGISTAVAITISKLLQRRTSNPPPIPEAAKVTGEAETEEKNGKKMPEENECIPPTLFGRITVWLLIAALLGAIVYRAVVGGLPDFSNPEGLLALSYWLVPLLLVVLLVFGYLKGVKVYEVLTSGAKEGFNVAVRIIPFLVAIFVAIGMFRASGALELLIELVNPVTSLIGMPAEALPMALIRPLSGSGAFGVMSEIVNQKPDSFVAYVVSIMQGSTETTFYVLAVYFGSVGIRSTRHALPAALTADAAGIIAAVLIGRLTFGIFS